MRVGFGDGEKRLPRAVDEMDLILKEFTNKADHDKLQEDQQFRFGKLNALLD